MSTRRDFLQTGLAGVVVSKTAFAQSVNPLSDALMAVNSAATYCYIEAGLSDPTAPGYHFNGVGYVHPQIFQQLADAIQLTGERIGDLGLVDALAASMPYGPPDLSQLAPSNMTWVANQAHIGLYRDFFTLVSLRDVASAQRMSLLRPPVYDGAQLQTDLSTAVRYLNQFAAGNFSASAVRRHGYLKNAMFQSNSTAGNNGVLTAAATSLGILGLGAIEKAGGVGVLSGSVVSAGGAMGTALAWTGVGLFVIGVAVLGYVIYRVYTQEHPLRGGGPWVTKPVDRDVPIPKPSVKPPLYPPLMPGTPPATDGYTETMTLA